VLAPDSLTFHYAANGLDVVKTIGFDSSYVVTVDAQVKRNGVPVRALVEWPAGLGDMEEFLPSSLTRSQVFTPSFFAWSLDGKQDSQAAAKVSGKNTLTEPYSYAAITDLYFAAVFLPDSPDRAIVVTLHNTIDLPTDLSDPNSQKKPANVLGLAMGDTSGSTRLRLFAGPKAMDTLTSIHAIGADATLPGPALSSRARCSQLGLGHHRRHRHLQPAHASHAPVHDEVLAEDDAHPAQSRSPQAALRPSQDQRPQKGRDEHRDDGPLQDRGREYVRQLPAYAHPDAALLRLLSRAGQRH
jgi:hypothetical protein